MSEPLKNSGEVDGFFRDCHDNFRNRTCQSSSFFSVFLAGAIVVERWNLISLGRSPAIFHDNFVTFACTIKKSIVRSSVSFINTVDPVVVLYTHENLATDGCRS